MKKAKFTFESSARMEMENDLEMKILDDAASRAENARKKDSSVLKRAPYKSNLSIIPNMIDDTERAISSDCSDGVRLMRVVSGFDPLSFQGWGECEDLQALHSYFSPVDERAK